MRAMRKIDQTIRGTTSRQEGPWPIMQEVVRTGAMTDTVARCEAAFPAFRRLFQPDVTYAELFDGTLGHEFQFLMLQSLACLRPVEGWEGSRAPHSSAHFSMLERRSLLISSLSDSDSSSLA